MLGITPTEGELGSKKFSILDKNKVFIVGVRFG